MPVRAAEPARPDTPGQALAQQIASQHLDALAKHGAAELAAQLRPTPSGRGRRRGPAASRSIPSRARSQRRTHAELHHPGCHRLPPGRRLEGRRSAGSQPRLAINRHYEGLIGKASRDDDSYLRSAAAGGALADQEPGNPRRHPAARGHSHRPPAERLPRARAAGDAPADPARSRRGTGPARIDRSRGRPRASTCARRAAPSSSSTSSARASPPIPVAVHPRPPSRRCCAS